MNNCRALISALKLSVQKAIAVSPATHSGWETSLTFVFSFVPDADPIPSLAHRSHPGQQISHTDEGAEFPIKKKNEKAND